jgi:GNAT superfamily N-acetyltransferase
MMYLTEPLNSKHKKEMFACGKASLDDYIHTQASQDVKRKLSVCFVLPDIQSNGIKGYYTLSNNSIPGDHLPVPIQKKLPASYKTIPATLLGRLGVDQTYRGQGIGKLSLADALKRSYDLSKILVSFAVVVDPLDLEAQAFYEKFDFIRLPDSKKMFLPMKTIALLFE